MRYSVIKSLMKNNDISMDEAKEIKDEMLERIISYGEDPEDVLYDYGLELDYADDLLLGLI